MELIVVLVFVGVFTAVALPLLAVGAGPSSKTEKVLAALASAVAAGPVETHEKIVDFRKQMQLSSIPWLNRRLLKFEMAPYLHKVLGQANLSWSPGKLLVISATCFAIPAYLIHLRFGSILIALLIGVLLAMAPFGWVFMRRSKRFNAFQKGLPEALDLMVSGLRAGHSLLAAIGLVARECADPVGCEFKLCFDEQNYGLELTTAIDNMIERVPLQELRIMATAMMIQKESGGNLAEVLDKTAYAIREGFRLRKQIMVHTAQGRLTGLILTLLPIVLAVVLYFINPAMMSILWTRAIGIKLLWASFGMMVVGGLIIRHIVNMDV